MLISRLRGRAAGPALFMALAILLTACAAQLQAPVVSPEFTNGSATAFDAIAPALSPPRSGSLDGVSLFNAGNRFTPWLGRDRYLGEVQPLLGKRCVACHGCTDAPCQLKLTSFEMVDRGATRISYLAPRLLEAPYPASLSNPPTFHPLLGRGENGDIHPNASVLLGLVREGMTNVPGSSSQAPGFDPGVLEPLLRQHRDTHKFSCVANNDEMDGYLTRNPGAGMPLGMPALSTREFETLQAWIADGAPGPVPRTRESLGQSAAPKVLRKWEHFLNGSDNKTRLAARYIYEHVYAADIHFDEMPGEFYRLIRSSAPPGTPVSNDRVTPLASEDPGSDTFYYRFSKITALIARKDHNVWRVSNDTLDYLDRLFIRPSWGIPDSEIQRVSWQRSSPFHNFAQIPAVLRYRFMLDNAKLLIEAMVRSSSCIGRTATYAISDHFWVFFLRPEVDVSSGAANFRIGDEAVQSLAADQERFLTLMQAQDHYDANRTYTASWEEALRSELAAEVSMGRRPEPGLRMEDIWNGDGDNPNAWLTVLRHDASATVHYGQVGGFPQTVWVLNYTNFERIYYNLVVDFKFWGGLAHKIVTWQAMSQHRLEGEDLFLSFLPEGSRTELRKLYSGNVNLPAAGITGLIGKPLVGRKIRKLIDLYPMLSNGRPALTHLPGRERADLEFLDRLRDYMGPAVAGTDDLNYSGPHHEYSLRGTAPTVSPTPVRSLQDWEHQLPQVLSDRGIGRLAPYLPGITFLRVGDSHERRVYTLIGNRGYLTHDLLFSEEQARDPARDTVSIYKGMLGDYPQLFLDIPLQKAGDVLTALRNIREDDATEVLRQLRKDYAVARNSDRFWPFVDWLHNYMVHQPAGYIYGGILDLSLYELPDP